MRFIAFVCCHKVLSRFEWPKSALGITGILLLWLGGISAQAFASNRFPAPAVALTVTSAGGEVGLVAAGTLVTLHVTVSSVPGRSAYGLVTFCDAADPHCTDIHLLGSMAVNSAGIATLNIRPGIGNHSYHAMFAPYDAQFPASSPSTQLVVTGKYPTTTTLIQTGVPGNYDLLATVTGIVNASSLPSPSGTISFENAASHSAVLLTAATGEGTSSLGFLNASTPRLSQQANAIATADFNGDGNADLAVSDASPEQTQLAILLGKGDGTFTATAASPAAGIYPNSIAVGDFNHDGNADLAVTGANQSLVTVLLGKGDGTFAAAPSLTLPGTPQAQAVADFSKDGIEDLAVLTGNSVSVFISRGDGTFTDPVTTPVSGVSLVNLAVADFTGDSQPDLAVVSGAEQGTVTILRGSKSGLFTALPPIAAGASPVWATAADFNQDGVLDLAIADADGLHGTPVTILLGTVGGTFTPGQAFTVPGQDYKQIIVSDFNQDGIADLGVGEALSGTFAVCLGKGDGTFEAGVAEASLAPLGPGYLALADFNADGISDLAIPSRNGSVAVQLTQPARTVTATVTHFSPDGPGPISLVASYPGDATFAASTSSAAPIIVPAASPRIAPAGGFFSSSQTVTITEATPGTTIYYSVTGSDGFVPYTGPITLSHQGPATVAAYATAPGYQQSVYTYAYYTLDLPHTAAPALSLAAGVYSGAQRLTIVDSMPAATIYYTVMARYPRRVPHSMPALSPSRPLKPWWRLPWQMGIRQACR